ncbi:STAS domain-containing protein [Mycobacterium deserti]|uniref:Sulfate transporter n=1 Tax=Mycobacterium deserti TaxID=2978347 RepID=A0ABT2M7V7_9MYCO|nr:STAS domain-containing protein [Mycobacterium deserti]MCT7658339.1 sulfate transporter [Mycobacterium deserti]
MTARPRILVREAARDGISVLIVDGVLDSSTYLALRDRIVKAALDGPPAVVVNVSALRTPTASAYAVFSSARWQVSRWPDVPVLLVCGHATGRDALRRQGITRYVPVYGSLDAALAALDGIDGRLRQRRCAELAPGREGVKHARELITEWLWDWGYASKIKIANAIATELVDNVRAHTDSGVAELRVESRGSEVTIAVSDRSARLATRIESAYGTFRLSGLHLVAALADAWGCTPSSSGKTVWATIA